MILQGVVRASGSLYFSPPQAHPSPLIIDDICDVAEIVALGFGGKHHGGLLAKADYQAALLSMSGSGKEFTPGLHDYTTRRALQSHISLRNYNATRSLLETDYSKHPQTGYPDQPEEPSPKTYDRQADQMPYSASPFREPRAVYEITQPPASDSKARKPSKVTSFYPERGPQGTSVYIYISTTYDLAYTPLTVSLMFASKLCTPIVDRLETRGSEYNYQLTVEAPSYAATAWGSPIVPITLQLQHNLKTGSEKLSVGSFLYTDGVESQECASPLEGSRKRKIFMESADSRIASKKISSQHLHSGTSSYAGSPYAGQNKLCSYQQQPSSSNYVYGMSRTYAPSHERQDDHARRSTQSGPERSLYSISTAASQSAWSSPYFGQSARSPALPGPSSTYTSLSSTPSSINSSSGPANPPLIRTSTLQSANSLEGATAAASGSSTYPYGYKAVLKIEGDLDSMGDDWSAEELTAKRRLVQFFRAQNNNTIDADFQAVPPEQGAPKGGICISCIWWAERQECYVTSVDTIYLLEALVAVRFTVEEKNRIRRNLEGFRPTTVSKGRPDSEDFFKVIMDFPNPKPRNIEKDIKVFPWKTLAHALKKIIGKYSASYSSTASAMLTPRSSIYPGLSDTATERRRTASSRSTSNSTTSSGYANSIMSSAVSPSLTQTRASEPAYSEPPVYPVTAPNVTYSYSVPTTQSQYVSQEHIYPSAGTVPSAGLDVRASWDLNSYLDTSPTMPHGLSQTADYKPKIMSPATTQASGTRDIR